MIRYTPLLDLTESCFGRFDHPGEEHHHDPKLEVTSEYSVSRVEKGKFSLEIEGGLWELGPGHYFLNCAGMEYRCRHFELVPTRRFRITTTPCLGALRHCEERSDEAIQSFE